MLKSEIKNILETPAWILLIAASAFYLTGLFMYSHFVWSTDIYASDYKLETGFENSIEMVRSVDFIRYLLSPLYIFTLSGIKLVKALGRLNIYHLAFMLFIAWCIRIYTNRSFLRILGIIIYTYGLGFLLLQGIMILIFM